ncbi:solanesyl diphosphate synthase 3, chloroplastic/mitochondrial isoform X1 [Lactuca sativa]|uniref:solanesyl diphosphate synthase 3, chloroplastic/mitochondrial isoform X1 n=1 Tax=Lactuca sativa TaxID=4236 RepID=UPI000CD98695|nr:solanesyl diphosphate synthase 3, chloroplastic/mitochondrial isoform X1 [Lactuca sativa]
MNIYRGISRMSRITSCYNRCRWLHNSSPHHQLSHSSPFKSPMEPSEKVLGCRVIYPWISRPFSSGGPQPQYDRSSVEDQVDPFSLVADELSIVANRLRSMVVAEVPKLASAAEYFFKMGVEGKRFRPTVILLMATALNVQISKPASEGVVDMFSTELRLRQQSIAEITEMIHVASLLHDDVLDDADTRRGIGSLNFVMGNKLAVLAGDFLLSRACITLASLKNTEVVSLIATAVEHLVTGETMQMSTSAEQRSRYYIYSNLLLFRFFRKYPYKASCDSLTNSLAIFFFCCSMDYYLQKTYYKTASLISNSCKSIALLTGQTTEVAMLAYEYGKNLGLAFQLIDDVLDFTGTSSSLGKGALSDIHHGIVTAPILYAMEEFPELRTVVDRGLDDPENVNLALEYLGKSHGIQRTRELAAKHASLASAAIDSLPENDDEDVQRSRRALIELTHRVINRTK